jgi:hypothetical protein
MNTSYFAKRIVHANPVSIAGKAPDWYKGRQYKKLAPLFWFFQKYKQDHDETFYTEQYLKEVLAQLNPQEVFEELGSDATLLCWEKSGEFCHRRLVAKWLEENLHIEVPELS